MMWTTVYSYCCGYTPNIGYCQRCKMLLSNIAASNSGRICRMFWLKNHCQLLTALSTAYNCLLESTNPASNHCKMQTDKACTFCQIRTYSVIIYYVFCALHTVVCGVLDIRFCIGFTAEEGITSVCSGSNCMYCKHSHNLMKFV